MPVCLGLGNQPGVNDALRPQMSVKSVLPGVEEGTGGVPGRLAVLFRKLRGQRRSQL